jgi:hypothetical protein
MYGLSLVYQMIDLLFPNLAALVAALKLEQLWLFLLEQPFVIVPAGVPGIQCCRTVPFWHGSGPGSNFLFSFIRFSLRFLQLFKENFKNKILFKHISIEIGWKQVDFKTGVYILENTPPPWGGNISRWHLGEKIWKGKEKKGENVKE